MKSIQFWLIIISLSLSFLLQSFSYRNLNQGWELVHSDTDYEILSANADFDDQRNGLFFEYKIFKFVNKTDKNLHLEWDYSLLYSNSNDVIENDYANELHGEISLLPKDSYVSSPYNQLDKDKVIFNKLRDNHSAYLVSYELLNITSTSK